MAYESLKDYPQAIMFHQQVLDIKHSLKDREGEAISLDSIGNAYESFGEYQTAIEFHKKSVVIESELSNKVGAAISLRKIGNAYSSLGEYDKAVEFYDQSLVIERETNNHAGEAIALGNLGNAYGSLGEYDKAIKFHEQSLEIEQLLGNQQGEVVSLNELASIAVLSGQYPEALRLSEESLNISFSTDNSQLKAGSLGILAMSYMYLGDYRKAEKMLQSALEMAKGDAQQEIEILPLLNLVETISENSKGNFEPYERALDYYVASNQKEGEMNVLSLMGLLYFSQDNYEQSVNHLTRSLAISKEIENPLGELSALSTLGSSYYNAGNNNLAANSFEASRLLARKLGNPLLESLSLYGLSLVHSEEENYAAAADLLLQAIAKLDGLRPNDLSDRDRIKLFETQTQVYKLLESVLILQDKFSEALEIAERGRTRSLVQVILSRGNQSLEEQTGQKLIDFDEILKVSRDQNITLVEYSLVETPVADPLLYIWVVQPTGDLHFKQVPLDDSFEGIADLVKENREAMGLRGRRGFAPAVPFKTADSAAQLRKLHQLLIEPIADLLPQDPEQRVAFIPQGDLFLVPFPALRDKSGTYLIEQHTILSAPSIQILDIAQRQAVSMNRNNRSRSNKKILAVGNPTMPKTWNTETASFTQLSSLAGAEQEANVIADFFHSKALTGTQATEQAVKAQIENARIVHLATHGLLEYGKPEESGVQDVPGAIALAPSQGEDGLLTAAEILDLNLIADLVVLSACDTGLGSITGDGVIGLSRSLIAAGTPSVVVSLWSVEDDSTTDLMIEFYRQMQEGKDKAQALRQAMLTTMKTHSSPRDWAAFTLIGEAD